MSVELPPLPPLPPTKRLSLHWHDGALEAFGHDSCQMRAYATEALAVQAAELAECKEAYALLFKENAKLRDETIKQQMLAEEIVAALDDALCIFHPEPGDVHLAPNWEARAISALKKAKEQP